MKIDKDVDAAVSSSLAHRNSPLDFRRAVQVVKGGGMMTWPDAAILLGFFAMMGFMVWCVVRF